MSMIFPETYPYIPVFFVLSAEKSFETLPKHNGAAFISVFFTFEFLYFNTINKLLHYNASLNKNYVVFD